ncbi:MAG: hypothetical protein KDA77_14185, partial [Planctomycetaceae bacterium]|nr:hypothetical protein [Planctomycetaceae bacterium]
WRFKLAVKQTRTIICTCYTVQIREANEIPMWMDYINQTTSFPQLPCEFTPGYRQQPWYQKSRRAFLFSALFFAMVNA